MTTLYSRLLTAGACELGARRYKGRKQADVFKHAKYEQLRWYVRHALNDFRTARRAHDIRWGYTRNAMDNVIATDGKREPRKAIRMLRDRIILAHPSLKRA